jgi:hypothetical protein
VQTHVIKVFILRSSLCTIADLLSGHDEWQAKLDIDQGELLGNIKPYYRQVSGPHPQYDCDEADR